MAHARILVVDDDADMRRMLERLLLVRHFEPLGAGDGREALERAADGPIDAALIDLSLPDTDGIKLMQQLREADPYLHCIIMTGYGDVVTAVSAMKAGAFHFIAKPFQFDIIENLVWRAVEAGRLENENRVLKSQVHTVSALAELRGVSPAVQQLRDLIQQVADTDANVLVLGESGTGKELVARALHELSLRSEQMFVPIN